MSTIESLLELEERGARALVSGAGAAFYRETMADDALMVVPGFVVDKATFVQGLGGDSAWQSLDISEPRVVELSADCAVLTYQATGKRAGEPDWIALMSSTYVRRADGWKLAFHQQTPMP